MTQSRATSHLERRRAAWLRLSELLDEVDRGGLRTLSESELAELARLHRSASAHLAQAQSGAIDPGVVSYLSGLVTRSHNTVYRTPSAGALDAVIRFLTTGYPRVTRRLWRFVLLSSILFFGSGLMAYALTLQQPALARLFLPPMLLPAAGPAPVPNYAAAPIPPGLRAVLSGWITQNNIKVGLYTFAGGITAGVVTCYHLVQNGVMVGALAGSVQHYGNPMAFFALIVPHGVIELWAIVLCGASGLRLAWSIIAPGRLRRVAALRAAAGEAVQLVLGTVMLFAVAGLIEGFVTPSALPDLVKLAIGPATGFVTALYFYGPLGRGAQAPGTATA